MAFKVALKSRDGRTILPGGKEFATFDDKEATVDDLKKFIAASRKKYYPSRQRLTTEAEKGKKGTVLATGKKLSDYGISDGDTIIFKDLGPQIGYSTVFFWEYIGPFVVYSLFYYVPWLFYGSSIAGKEHVFAQKAALFFWQAHYAKRIAETFLVHRFGHATMPVQNLIKNCSYYWGFAAFIAYFVNHPLYTPPSVLQTKLAIAAGFVCMLSNLRCHLILAGLRSPGATGYTIPRGFLFDYVTCANYFVEIWSWIFFAIATQSLPAVFFVIAGAGQMAIWAAAKHKRLRKLFDGKEGREKYPRRYIMFPPFF